jgi:hypothetical protein
VSLVRPKLEYASCFWPPFYDVHANKVERVKRKFTRFAMRGLGELHEKVFESLKFIGNVINT